MIPKIIHYCWFGGNPLPQSAVKFIETWKKFNPDYSIKEWNESNFDIHCCKYVEEAYHAKKWAFVSDYARFYALYNEGGVYFDTDIEVLKPFDDLLDCGAFFGFGWKTLTLPVFGASKGLECFKLILDYYNTRSFIKKDGTYDMVPIEMSAIKILQENYNLELNGQYQRLKEDIIIYPKEYFCSTKWESGKIYKNPKLYVIHYADASWLSEEEKWQLHQKQKIVRFLGVKLGTIVSTALLYIKEEGLKGLCFHAYNFILRLSTPVLMKLLSTIYINKKKVVFDNFDGRGYGDNPKYVAEELLSRKLGYKMIWIVRDESYKMPKGICTVKKCTFREVFHLATAGFWIENNRKRQEIYKNHKQKYIQLWHGFYPLKKIEKDAISTLPEEYILSASHDGKITDLMVSGCKERTKLYKNSFWYDGEVKEWGTPRNDIFFRNYDYKNLICNYFHIPTESNILLYAPTFRDDRSIEPYDIDFLNLQKTLAKRFGGVWYILIRLHPAVRELSGFIEYTDTIIDASSYDDIQELFAGSDVLISDYSDCMFEFSLQKKPVFLYASDLESYTHGRSFYYDIHELPYQIAESNSDLVSIISNFDDEAYQDRLSAFFDKIGVFEKGTASKSVVDYIINTK